MTHRPFYASVLTSHEKRERNAGYSMRMRHIRPKATLDVRMVEVMRETGDPLDGHNEERYKDQST